MNNQGEYTKVAEEKESARGSSRSSSKRKRPLIDDIKR
jgi:hypothetical protein